MSVSFSRHAVERYSERVRPGLDHGLATEDLLRVAEVGRFVSTPPGWMVWDLRSPLYLQVGDVVFPLRPLSDGGWQATTCLARGTLSPEARQSRSLARRRRRAHRGRRLYAAHLESIAETGSSKALAA